ncbi:hypothetical protein SDJN02_21939, partial [Cucurbita argyrosperma subsp. argyrosperma]
MNEASKALISLEALEMDWQEVYLVRVDTLLLDSCKISGWTDKEQHYGFYITQGLSGFWGAESTICCHHSPFSNYNWEWRCFDAQLQTCKL